MGYCTSLALDGLGYPHISYYAYGSENPKYAYRDVSGWSVETVDSEGHVGQYTSLALDDSGCPHISYYDDTNSDLKYAYWCSERAEDGRAATFPAALRLLAVCPSPATSEASILFSIGEGFRTAPGGISLGAYDALGRLLGSPAWELTPSGTHSVMWDLRSAQGTRVSPGVYFLRLAADGTEASDVQRLVVLK